MFIQLLYKGLIYIILNFYEELKIEYDLINNFSDLYTSLSKIVNEIKNAKSSSKKKQLKEDIINIIIIS